MGTPVKSAVQEIVCPCGITFEPPPWFDKDRDEPLCDECADHLRG
jgi:hypothetical protein